VEIWNEIIDRIDWNAAIDHLISATCTSVTTVIVAAITAYFGFIRGFKQKLDANTVETVKGKNASVEAARTAKVNTDKLDDIKDAAQQAGPNTVNVETVNVKVEQEPPVPPPGLPFH
jgi:hypothetical protein